MNAGESRVEMSSASKMSWTTMAYRVLRRPWRENRWSLCSRLKRAWSVVSVRSVTRVFPGGHLLFINQTVPTLGGTGKVLVVAVASAVSLS